MNYPSINSTTVLGYACEICRVEIKRGNPHSLNLVHDLLVETNKNILGMVGFVI